MHWKIKRDSFYSELYPLLGSEGIGEAGFFYDTAIKNVDINSSLALNCTPHHFLGLALAQKPAILLCTGAYCPPHEGHIEMMVLAKKALMEAGYDFVGGYMSPGHDEYINDKTGEQAIPIHYRLRLLQELIVACGQSNWLCIDPWEGLFNAVAINFTDVITRLELYLEKHIGKKIPVFYVCGGDNARFSLSFLLKGNCIVLGRPGYEERFLHYKAQLKQQQNILWVPANNPKNSSLIRQQQIFVPDNSKKLLLRVEEQDPRETAIIALLRPYFTELQLQYLSEQKAVFDKMDKSSIISLDAMLRADVNLEISRCYDLFGTRFLEFWHRPGSITLSLQVAEISKNKTFTLFDDDEHSGATLRFTKEYLEKAAVKIENIYTLSRSSDGEETLDCRDFIIGGAQNGLVVQLGADLLRVPYCYPYCCPFVRASIAEPMAFSKAVWRLNADYFREKGSCLSDLAPTWQRLFSSLGFSADASAASICDWHVEMLDMG